jgi:hypothetical protein
MNQPADQIKFRLLTYYIADLPFRDQRETMERPFFSLSKRKRLKPIDYKSPDGKVWVEVSPHQKYGMATYLGCRHFDLDHKPSLGAQAPRGSARSCAALQA